MHEMSLAINLLELAQEEAEKNGCNKLLRICVKYGAISGVMPEALEFCFEALISQTAHKGAILELEEQPLQLRCPLCGTIFGGSGQDACWMPCPKCGNDIGHAVEAGKELILSIIEACQDIDLPDPSTHR